MSQRQVQAFEEEVDVQALEERERAIRQLESDIVDVNTIFKELSTMVHEQGDMIDSIEANVESAQMRVEEGTNQLATASSYQVCNTMVFGSFIYLTVVSFPRPRSAGESASS